MSESTDPALSAVCQHCGKRFHLRRFVNRYTTHSSDETLGKPAPAKYCSPACRKDAYRVRYGHSRSVPVAVATEVPSRSVPASSTPAPVSRAPFKTDRASDLDEFERIRAGRVLSRWEPCANPDQNGFDIPDFLQRT
jgi:hypothetical protein